MAGIPRTIWRFCLPRWLTAFCWAVLVMDESASAARADYAEAAAVVLTTTQPANVIYELAGDEVYTLSQLAAEVRSLGKSVIYQGSGLKPSIAPPC